MKIYIHTHPDFVCYYELIESSTNNNISQHGKILHILSSNAYSYKVGQTVVWFTEFARLATEEEIRTLNKLLTFQ